MSGLLAAFWNRRQRRLRAGWRLLLHLLFSVAAVVGVAYPAAFILFMFLDLPFVDLAGPDAAWLIIGGLTQVVTITAVVLVCCIWPDRRHPADIGFRRFPAMDCLFGVTLGAVLMLAIFSVELACGWIEIERIGPPGVAAVASFLGMQLLWIILMIGIGVSEEVLARGYHMQNLAEGLAGMGPLPAIIVASILSSAVFGLLHAANPHASMIGIAAIVFAGLMFAVARITTGSLALPIGLHFSWNYVQGPILGFPVSGNETIHSLIAIRQGGPEWLTGGEFGPEAGVVGWLAMFAEIAAVLAYFYMRPAPRMRLKRSIASMVRYRRRRRFQK